MYILMNLNNIVCFKSGDVREGMEINGLSCMGTIIILK